MSTGDDHAFSEIYQRYWKLLFSVAYRRLKNVQLAEDVIHDVFASIWKNRDALAVTSLKHYLASATKYIVFAVIKKQLHASRFAETQTQTSTGFDTDDALHNKLLLAFVYKEVESLPEKCKLIFKHSRERGMTTKEIANELQIATKTVENQMNKALHQLRFSMRKMLQVFF